VQISNARWQDGRAAERRRSCHTLFGQVPNHGENNPDGLKRGALRRRAPLGNQQRFFSFRTVFTSAPKLWNICIKYMYRFQKVWGDTIRRGQRWPMTSATPKRSRPSLTGVPSLPSIRLLSSPPASFET